MTLKIFIQPGCPACPSAKELGKKLEKKIKVEYFDTSEPKGLAEATFYGVMATPTLILVENKDKVKKTWIGTPDEKEVLKEIKNKAPQKTLKKPDNTE
jgi:glutaredoxin